MARVLSGMNKADASRAKPELGVVVGTVVPSVVAGVSISWWYSFRGRGNNVVQVVGGLWRKYYTGTSQCKQTWMCFCRWNARCHICLRDGLMIVRESWYRRSEWATTAKYVTNHLSLGLWWQAWLLAHLHSPRYPIREVCNNFAQPRGR